MTDQPTRLGDARPDEPGRPAADGIADAAVPVEPVTTSEAEPAQPDTASEAEPAQPDVGAPAAFWRRRSTIVVAAVLAGGAVLYLTAYLAAGRDLASGATVLGVEVGDLSRAEAEARLADELPALVEVPIAVQVAEADETFSVAPAESGLSIDIAATVDTIPGANADPFSLARALFGAGAIDPVPSVDRPALEAAVSAIAEHADTEPVNASVAFDDGAVVTSAAAAGRAVDIEAGAEAIETAYFGGPGRHELPLPEVVLPTTEVEPVVTDAEVERAVTEFAEPAMSGPVTLAAGDQTATLEPAVIGSALTMAPDADGVLAPTLDGAALASAAGDAFDEIGRAGYDATIRIENGAPVISAGRSGLGITPDALAAAVLPVLTETGEARTANVELTEIDPELTTEGAQALGVKEVISEFTTRFPAAAYRNTNIGLAARRIDNTLLLPGETFSLNDLVGERTAANGFAVGWTIDSGRLKEDFGGGVSQVATTTYHAAFLAGLEDVYHQPHSIYFDRYPVGQEATIAWGRFDMSFKNDTPYGVLVDTSFSPSGSDPGALTVRIWSTRHFRVESSVSGRSKVTSPQTVYDTNTECEAQRGWEGFSITSYRKVWTPDGTLVKDEADPWTYRPNPTVVCGPEPEGAEPGR